VARDIKETILDIGERLFAQRGYRAVSIREVAQAAGLGTASFYTYFPSKESYYAQILERLERRGSEEVEKRVSGFQSPLNKLKALYRYTAGDLRENEILRGIYTGDKRFLYPGLKGRGAKEGGLMARIEDLIGRILQEGARKGVFRVDVYRNPRQMLMTIFGSLLSVRNQSSAEDLIPDMSLLLERGIKRWPRLRMRDERLDRRASRIP
jgi:AcrR family transcriptional regulator